MKIQQTSLLVWLLLLNVGFVFNPIQCKLVDQDYELDDENDQKLSSTTITEAESELSINDGDTTKTVPSTNNVNLETESTDSISTLTTSQEAKTISSSPTTVVTTTTIAPTEILADKKNPDKISTNLTPGMLKFNS